MRIINLEVFQILDSEFKCQFSAVYGNIAVSVGQEKLQK